MEAVQQLEIDYTTVVPESADGLLAVVVPGTIEASVTSPLRIGLAMPVLGDAHAEVWRTDLPIERGVDGAVVWSSAGDLLVGAIAVADAGPIAARADDSYRSVISFVRRAGFPNILRLWNQFPRILVQNDGLERYQAFCTGRYAAFESAGYSLEGDLPAASAVGTSGDGLLVTVVASRRSAGYFENPRQVSAFHYPRQYGPKSPSFARASRVETEGGALIFVSGTASIVGHVSLHCGDAAAQVDETVENLRLVYGAAAGRELRSLREAAGALYRIYVKREEDLETIRERFLPRIGDDATCLWLRGDICRAELLVEVEMIGRE
ncbi:MAG: hypothetical protein HYU52_14605 [Acidobacteria bacterium]|nr:hypothetical protein [Acidobacteriota bacterium]